MTAANEKIGLIAGRGAFPIDFAQAARQNGHHVTALAVKGFASPQLAEHVDAIHWLDIGQVDTLIRLCHEDNIGHLAFAGKIDHVTVFNLGQVEARAFQILTRLKDRKAESIARAVIDELESENIEVLDSSLFLKSNLPAEGLLTPDRPLRVNEQKDIEFAWPLAREIARLDIGQALIVKEGVVVAVEGVEGTDEAIRRAGQLAGPGTVVVKVSRPTQDFRFDLPVIGLQTVATMAEAGASALAVCAGETLLFDREKALALATESDIALVARSDAKSSPTSNGEPDHGSD
jgi:DUF1009 family protein